MERRIRFIDLARLFRHAVALKSSMKREGIALGRKTEMNDRTSHGGDMRDVFAVHANRVPLRDAKEMSVLAGRSKEFISSDLVVATSPGTIGPTFANADDAALDCFAEPA